MKRLSHWVPAAILLGAAGTAAIPAAGSPAIRLLSARPETLSTTQAGATPWSPAPASASGARNPLVFHGKVVRLTVNTGPENDMLSYWINGVRNPTVIIPRGSDLKVLFVNRDKDMQHDLRFTATRPPFTSRPREEETVGTPAISHRMGQRLFGEAMDLRLEPGSYSYVCTVRGHAKAGMWGTLLVR